MSPKSKIRKRSTVWTTSLGLATSTHSSASSDAVTSQSHLAQTLQTLPKVVAPQSLSARLRARQESPSWFSSAATAETPVRSARSTFIFSESRVMHQAAARVLPDSADLQRYDRKASSGGKIMSIAMRKATHARHYTE